MKRILCIFLAICLLLCVVGCKKSDANDPAVNPDNSQTDDTLNQQETPEFKQKPMVAVSVPTVTEASYDANNNPIFHYTYQKMNLILPEPEIAESVMLDFLNRVDSTRQTYEELLSDAQNAVENGMPSGPYVYRITYSPTRIDQGVLSFLCSNTTFTGGAHSGTVYSTLNYDLTIGEPIRLDRILSSSTQNDVLIQLIIDALSQIKEDASIFEEYEDIVRDQFKYGFSSCNTWYFSTEGLCFSFSPYEIAPRSSGLVIAQIPYSKLAGIIQDPYFPAEKDVVQGELSAELFTAADLENYTQFSEVVIQRNAEKVLLHTEQTVYDVKIDMGTWGYGGAEFISSCTVFAAAHLTPGDAVVIETDIPDTEPGLRITYRSADKIVTKYLSQSGKDGSILLLDEKE